MKRVLSLLLALLTVLSMAGCGAQPEEPAAQVPVTEAATQPPATEEPTAAQTAEPEASDARLFLKVSGITFSVVGESDDIYLGLVPRELVTWESDDPAIVSVENGVLTANGVGTTTVRASYGDQLIEVSAGCLATTREELEALDFEIRCTPTRLPPEVDLEQPCTYFDNAAIVGDSITYFMFQWENKNNYLGDMLFLARGGVSMSSFVKRIKNVYYKGQERNIEDAIADSQVERAYFLMGSNDISATTQRPFLHDHWDIMMERFRETCPDTELVLMSNIPLYGNDQDAKSEKFRSYNEEIANYNVWLRQYAKDNGCLFIDLAYYVQDHNGRMPQIYSQGDYHMNETGCVNWMKILRYYAQFELEGGTLS